MDRLTDRLNMTIVVDWDIIQHSNKLTQSVDHWEYMYQIRVQK